MRSSPLARWIVCSTLLTSPALLAGDAETGVTIMQMDAGLDTGPMIDVVKVPISGRDTAGSLLSKLARVGAVVAGWLGVTG